MAYDRTSNPLSPGEEFVTGPVIHAWFQSRAAWGAGVVGLPQVPIPDDLGQAIYDENRALGLNHVLRAGQSMHESAAAQSLIARSKRNYDGLGAENDDPTGKSNTFDTPRAGARAGAAHAADYAKGRGPWTAFDPRAEDMSAGDFGSVTQLAGYEQHWAFTKQADYDKTPLAERYGSKVAQWANELVAFARAYQGGSVADAPRLTIAFSSGHHNTASGNAQEKRNTAAMAEEFYRQARGVPGLNLLPMIPDGDDPDTDPGDGCYAGTYNDLARELVRRDQAGQRIDVAFEFHTEGAAPNVRGLFIIPPYWDAAGDHDTDIDGALGEDIVRRLSASLGIPLRSSGVLRPGIMAEYQTGVGGGGDRLGYFANTAAIKDHCTRFIVEVGAHSNAEDLAIQQSPDYASKAARAVLEALCAWKNIPLQPAGQPAAQEPVDTSRVVNGHVLGGGFRAYYEFLESKLGFNEALMLIGLPLNDEHRDEARDCTAQDFERARFEWRPGQRPETWDVLLGRVNAELLDCQAAG